MAMIHRREFLQAGIAASAGAILSCGKQKPPEETQMVRSTDYFLSREVTHNRWNKDLPPLLTMDSGETVTVETREASDRDFTIHSTMADVSNRDRSKVHPLTGPIYVNGAEPGDVLQIDLLEYKLPDWGWTVISPPMGFLGEEFSEEVLHIWRFNLEEQYAELKPGIRVSLQYPFLGVIGLAWDEPGEFRTIPPRTQGGNMDIKYLTRGSTVYLPVSVPGALLSVGDGHAAQGDGEVCISAIECDLTAQMRVTVRKDFQVQEPEYETAEYFAATGIATTIDEAARKATRHTIGSLMRRYQLTRNEAYMLCSVAMDLKICEAVDMPHYLVSGHVPKSIFM